MILADTGPLVAVANARDQHHDACQTLLETHLGPVLVPAPVIVEVCQLLVSRQGTHSEAASSPHSAKMRSTSSNSLRPITPAPRSS